MPPVLRRISWLSALTLGCAVGLLMAATAVAGGVLGNPFAASSANRLVAVFARHVATGRERELTSFAIFEDWKARATSFERLSGYTLSTVNLLGDPTPQTLRAAQVTSDFLETLDAAPIAGRGLHASAAAGASNVCIISHRLWRTRFAANPSIIGSVIHLEGINGIAPSGALTIVGIAPRALRFPEHVDIWTPLSLPERLQSNGSGQWFGVVGRLRHNVLLAAATAEMRSVMAAVQVDRPKQQPPHDANLVPLREVLIARYRALVLGLLATAGLLLVVVAASAGGVLVARALRAQVGDRIKLSLGANARRLLADAGRDGLWVGTVAFVAAVPVALVCLRAFDLVAAEAFDTRLGVGLTWLSLLTGLASAATVATALTLLVKAHSLRQIGKGGPWLTRTMLGSTRATARLRSGLIVAEIALTVLLLAMAGDLLTRVRAVRAVDLQFETKGLLTTRLALPPGRYADGRAAPFYQTLIDRVQAVPSVTHAAVSSDDPLFGVSANPEFTLQFENRVLTPEERVPILVNGVTGGYFATLGLRVLTGETPAQSSAATGMLEAAINETLAARLFPRESPIGRRFRFGGRNPPWWTIVGVVGDARNDGPLAPPKPTAYLSYPAFGKSDMTLLVKTSREGDRVMRDIREVIAALDPDLPVARIVSATQVVEARFASLRIGALVIAVLAAAASMLSGLGLFGVLSAVSTQSRPEIGLRIALGASPRDVMGVVVRRAGVLVAMGLIVGATCTAAVGVTFGSFVAVHVPSAVDVFMLIASVAVVALVAAAWPAWQAMRVSPAETLRAE